MRTKIIPLSEWTGSSLEVSARRVPLAQFQAQPILPDITEVYGSLIAEVLSDSTVTLIDIRIDTHGNVLPHVTGAIEPGSDVSLAIQMAADLCAIGSGIDLTTEQAIVIGIRLQENFRILDARVAGLFAHADAAIRQKRKGLDSRNKRRAAERRERETKARSIIEAAIKVGWPPGTPLARLQWNRICSALGRPTTDANRKAIERTIQSHNESLSQLDKLS